MAELNSSPGKSSGKTPRKRVATRVDLTAMVDLAFLLITFFILTTTMQKQKMFKVAMPDDTPTTNPPELSENRAMTICLGKNDQVVSYLGMTIKPLTEPQVSGFTKEGIRKDIIEMGKRVRQTTGKDMYVIIKASDHAVYSDMVNALDELHIAGATGYAIEDITPAEVSLLKEKGIY